MDYSKFISDDFESKDWINDLISSIPPESLEKELTDHVIKLQFYIQEMNSVVDDSIQNAFQSLPRVTRDLESVRQEAVSLHEQMNLVKLEIEKVEKSTQESMCSLLKIDAQKKRLCEVEKSLQEADSWSQIYDNINVVMQSGDLNKMVDKISSLQHSLSMLTTAPDYDDRKKNVEHLCLNFLAILGPQLIQAFFNADSTFIHMAFNHLAKIDRTDSGSKYYNAWFKPYVANMWTQCHDEHGGDNSEELLKDFFDKLLTFCHDERERHLFHDADRVLIAATTEALAHLKVPFDNVVSDVYPVLPDSGSRLIFLSKCLKVVDQFSTDLEVILEGTSPEPLKGEAVSCKELAHVIYSQFRGVNDIFATDCKRHIQQKLNAIKMDSAEITDCIDVLDQSVEKVVDLAREAVRYCQSTTHFVAVDHLAGIIKELFSVYLTEFKRVCVNITLKLSSKQISATNKADNVDTSIEDYYFLQDGIRLTSIGGHLSSKFELFSQEMLNCISGHVQELNSLQIKKRVFLRPYLELFIEPKQKRTEISEFWQLTSKTSSPINLLKFPTLAPLEEARQSIKFQLLHWLNKTVFEGAIEPVKRSLCGVAKSGVWHEELETGELLPQFAYSPQEYITRIGQFFMTLPQQLEPFINENNRFYDESLLNGQLPHLSDNFLSSWLKGGEAESRPIQVAHVWLESVVLGSLSQLLDQWLAIERLSVSGRQQLVADTNYITGLVEDLGLQASSDVRNFSLIVAATSKDSLAEVNSSCNLSPKVMDFMKKILF